MQRALLCLACLSGRRKTGIRPGGILWYNAKQKACAVRPGMDSRKPQREG